MPSQITDPTTIEDEKEIIRKVAGVSNDISLNDRGWDSRVYSFDKGHYFFKFPRSEKIRNGYKYEIAAIKFAATLNTDIAAQRIVWEHPTNAYFGYEGMQGQPVSELIGELDKAQKQSIGKALGSFLVQFHKLQLPDARTMTSEDEAKQIQRWYEDSKSVIGQEFSDSEQQRLHQLVYEDWPARLVELGNEPVLSHGDLHFENILFSSDGKVGIIDFGDVAYYDRSKDFLELENDEDIFGSVLKAYGHSDALLRGKIKLRQCMIQIINLGFFAGKGDRANIALTVEKIRSEF